MNSGKTLGNLSLLLREKIYQYYYELTFITPKILCFSGIFDPMLFRMLFSKLLKDKVILYYYQYKYQKINELRNFYDREAKEFDKIKEDRKKRLHELGESNNFSMGVNFLLDPQKFKYIAESVGYNYDQMESKFFIIGIHKGKLMIYIYTSYRSLLHVLLKTCLPNSPYRIPILYVYIKKRIYSGIEIHDTEIINTILKDKRLPKYNFNIKEYVPLSQEEAINLYNS